MKVASRFTVYQRHSSMRVWQTLQVMDARVLCHFAALVHLFTDEGDGERVIRCWKLCMHAGMKTNYALEALRLQFQFATLQPNLVHQLTWGRFVNTHGGKGRNLPCDLHNEHVNRQLIANMGANFTLSASTRAARAVSFLRGLLLVLRDRQASIQRQLLTAGSQMRKICRLL